MSGLDGRENGLTEILCKGILDNKPKGRRRVLSNAKLSLKEHTLSKELIEQSIASVPSFNTDCKQKLVMLFQLPPISHVYARPTHQ